MIVILAVVILILFITLKLQQRSKYPPGPFSWPFVGNQFYLRKLTRKLGGQHFAFLELSKQYNSGVISLRLGLNNIIVISDSKLINEILHKDEYDGRPWNEFIKIRNMGMRKGITMNDGPEWKELRSWSVRTLRTVGFAQRHMIDLLMNELTIILGKLKNTEVHYIRPIISPAVINVLWTLVTAKRPSEDSNRLQSFMDLLERRARVFDMSGGILSTFPWIRHIAPETSGFNILQTLNEELKNFLMDTINEHKKNYVAGNEIDFIDMFLREMFAQKDNDTVFTDENLLVTLIDFFIAGTANTTSTLDFSFLLIANHQDVQRQLHEEIDNVIGRNRLPELNDRVKMPFTEAVLTECQRMWLVTPIIGPRRVLDNMTLGGYDIPKDSTILINLFCNNMNPEFYPDPTAFKPERFFKNGAYQTDENIILFGKGHRRCPGEALSKSAMFLLFVGIMQNYRLLPKPGNQNIKMDVNPGLTLSPKPYEMLIVPR